MKSNEKLDVEFQAFEVLQEGTDTKSNETNDPKVSLFVKNELIHKYFHSWLRFTKDRQYASEQQSKNEKIEAFLNNIIKKKNELNSKKPNQRSNTCDSFSNISSSTQVSKKSNTDRTCFRTTQSFQHRYQSQKNIIALQKTKLEQQERIIEELKFKKIIEDASLSSEAAADVRKTLQNCDRNIKPKLKCVAGEDDIDDETDKYLTLTCTRVPKFLQKMEHRAREREEKRAVVQERRRQKELEREKMKEQLELSRQQMDQEEKNRRINEFKEKRRQEQLIAIRNKEHRERIRALTVMADLHYEKKLMVKYGLETWKLYIVLVKNDLTMAIAHHLRRLLFNHFLTWNNNTKNNINKRNQLADDLYNTKIIKFTFNQWKMEHKIMVNKRQVAEDWYDVHVTERLFIQWKMNVAILKIMRKRQWDLAVQHYNSHLMWRILDSWEMLPKINSMEREHEARKQRWRNKVQQVIPDFIPRHLDI